MKQLELVQVGLGLEGGDLTVTQVVMPVTGSDMAAFFNAQGAPSNSLAGLLPRGGFATFASDIKITDKFIEDYLGFVGEAMGMMQRGEAEGLTEIDTAGITALVRKMLAAYEPGRMAVSVDLSEKGMSMSGLMAVKDVSKIPELRTTLMPEYVKTLNSMYSKMGLGALIKWEPDAAQYKGVKIDRMTFDMTSSMVGAPDEAKKAMQTLLGDPMAVYQAFVGDKNLFTMGTNGAADMNNLIDRVKAGGAKPMPNHVYLAYDMSGLPGFIKKMNEISGKPSDIPDEALPIFEALKISGAGKFERGRFIASGRIPLMKIIKAGIAASAAAAKPAPEPAEMPEATPAE
ncbi:MAG: hypothetical protein KAI64_06490, partial [Thermoplasmata archaeon]|nr:hypothetical protein [Thermoplasmata archaeon]